MYSRSSKLNIFWSPMAYIGGKDRNFSESLSLCRAIEPKKLGICRYINEIILCMRYVGIFGDIWEIREDKWKICMWKYLGTMLRYVEIRMYGVMWEIRRCGEGRWCTCNVQNYARGNSEFLKSHGLYRREGLEFFSVPETLWERAWIFSDSYSLQKCGNMRRYVG